MAEDTAVLIVQGWRRYRSKLDFQSYAGKNHIHNPSVEGFPVREPPFDLAEHPGSVADHFAATPSRFANRHGLGELPLHEFKIAGNVYAEPDPEDNGFGRVVLDERRVKLGFP
jgi:hypothetical protein